jgi:hypothetical protein
VRAEEFATLGKEVRAEESATLGKKVRGCAPKNTTYILSTTTQTLVSHLVN